MFNKLLKDSKMQVQLNANTIINKGNYGNQYDALTDRVLEAKVKTGKRGRPMSAPAPVYMKANDLFGRVPDSVRTTVAGRRIVGKASVSAVYVADLDDAE
jgi:hypothetical protein